MIRKTTRICTLNAFMQHSFGSPNQSSQSLLVAQMVKHPPAGDSGSISGSRRSLGEGNGNTLQYSCLENSSTRGAWWVTVHVVAESHVAEQLTDRRVHAWRTQTYVVGTENGVWELAYSPHSWQREHQPK